MVCQKIIFSFALMIANISFAETILCHGKSDTSHAVELTINMSKKKSTILFLNNENNAGGVLQGLSLHEKSNYKTSKMIRYHSYNSTNSFLELTLDDSGKILSSKFNEPLAGFVDSPFDCLVTGNFPEAPICDAYTNELLIAAIKNNQPLQDLEWQLYCGAKVNYKDKNGCTSLLYAFDSGCGVKKSSNQGPPGGAFAQTNIVTDLLIQNGAYIDLFDPIDKQTALIKAARFGVSDVYENFIASEANFNAQDVFGNTALMYSVLWGDPFIVKDILAGNPDRRLKNKKGETAFDLAKQWQKDRVIDLVRIPDSSVFIKGNVDGTCSPLKIEIKKGQTVELILSATDKMFKLESNELNLEIMADRNSTSGQILSFDEAGIFKFSCGLHGSSNNSKGEIIISN